jgi:anion-transporting  ArsA/GET3 family ATPase
MSGAAAGGFEHVVDDAAIVICCGSGGVGKTTAAASLAMAAAERGRRAVVVTIDPAKRLADSLGLGSGGLTNEPATIEGTAGDGRMWAMMLDTRATFDALVERYSSDTDQRDRILSNRFYRNISGALSGTQEYMAAEKLYELHGDERFDLVVVDTPPTRDALDFLDAPARLTRFLDHRLYRVLMAPTRVGMRVVNAAAQVFLRTLSKVVGGDVINDATAFFQAFEGMEAGFRDRAQTVTGLLHAPSTQYVVVASPRHDTVTEAAFFTSKLRSTGLTTAGVIVNRLHPRFGAGTAAEAAGSAHAARGATARRLWTNLAELRQMAEREEAAVAPLLAAAGDAAVARVPLLARDVHDLEGLRELAGHLVADA